MTSTSAPGGHGDGRGDERDAEADDLGALAALVTDLRHTLLRHHRAGRWATSAAASPRASVQVPGATSGSSSRSGAMAGAEGASAPPAGVDDDANVPPWPEPDEAPPPSADRWTDDDSPVRQSRRSLAVVRAELGDCQRCELATTRTKLVFGTGAEDAPLVFVGEAPGADEDRTGEPFVGRAGELLDKMIEAMGWTRASVYITNLLKCRPPGNRNPGPDEARACRPFLVAQLESIAPRIIVALGRPAANALLGTDAPISALRGQFHERLGVKIMPTFHPAYLLRDPKHKREAWSDLQRVMAELERIGVAAPNPR